MLSDLKETFHRTRDQLTVPEFPRFAIRNALGAAPSSNPQKRRLLPAFVATLSLVAIAAAAEIATQSRIHFVPAGGMVIDSANGKSRAISSEAEVREAASHLNFNAILPSGLPDGTRPIRLYTAGQDLMAVTYDLPGAWRASHHLAWIFLAHPATLDPGQLPEARYHLRPGRTMSMTSWRVGGEEVIVVSNGLTPAEVAKIKQSMR